MYVRRRLSHREQKLRNSYNASADFLLNQKYVNKSKNELSDAMNEGSPSAWLTKVTSHGLPMIPIEN